jgi:hypothetical protein
VTHIGIVNGSGRARSKWGIGQLYEHALMEVPIQYGDDVESIGRDSVLNHFVDYAWTMGFRLERIAG